VAAVGELDVLGGALERRAALDRMMADIVDLKFFCGFPVPGIAAMKGVSERTVERGWQKARIFLRKSARAGVLEA
jgi:hypothetical protein